MIRIESVFSCFKYVPLVASWWAFQKPVKNEKSLFSWWGFVSCGAIRTRYDISPDFGESWKKKKEKYF